MNDSQVKITAEHLLEGEVINCCGKRYTLKMVRHLYTSYNYTKKKAATLLSEMIYSANGGR